MTPKQTPLLLSPDLAQKVWTGEKTGHRVLIKPQPPEWTKRIEIRSTGAVVAMQDTMGKAIKPCPYGGPGDLLWVRENFWAAYRYNEGTDTSPGDLRFERPVHFAALGRPANTPNAHYPEGLRNGAIAAPNPYAIWFSHPSIHMPKWACRTWAVIKKLTAETLDGIDDSEAWLEGCPQNFRDLGFQTPRAWLLETLASLYPGQKWFWRIEFTKTEGGKR